MPISNETFTESGLDTADVTDITAPIVFEQVTEPVTSSDVVESLPEGGHRTATEDRLAERFDVDDVELTKRAIQVVLNELAQQGYLTKRVVPTPESPSGFEVYYQRADHQDGDLDELRDVASASLASAEDGSDTEEACEPGVSGTNTDDDAPTVDVSSETLTTGSLLKDRYRLETDLGGKSHITVWKATDTDTDESVVVKIGTNESTELITNEGVQLKRLATAGLEDAIPNLRKVFELQDGTVLIKEYIEGITLADLVEAENGWTMRRRPTF